MLNIKAHEIRVGDTVIFDASHSGIVYNVIERHGRKFVTFEGARPTTASFRNDAEVTVTR